MGREVAVGGGLADAPERKFVPSRGQFGTRKWYLTCSVARK